MSCLPPNIHNKTPFSDPISSFSAEFLSSRKSPRKKTRVFPSPELKGISLLGQFMSLFIGVEIFVEQPSQSKLIPAPPIWNGR